jgi:hypothetical protein
MINNNKGLVVKPDIEKLFNYKLMRFVFYVMHQRFYDDSCWTKSIKFDLIYM